MKLVNDVLVKIKGEKKVDETLCGRGAYSNQSFDNLCHALLNDTTYNVTTVDKEGKKVTKNLSSPFREALKKTAASAKFPQKSEVSVYDTCEINTTGIADFVRHVVEEWTACGKKFDLPPTESLNASIYLQKVPAKNKTVQVRDIKTKENLGTTTIDTKEYIQLRAKSPAPKKLQTKVRRDINGKIIVK